MSTIKGKYPREFYILIFSSITVFLAFETTVPILPLYVTNKGASTFEVGVIIGLLSFSLMLFKIPLGFLSERVSAKFVLAASALVQSFCQLSYSLLPSIIWFYPLRVLHAVSIAAIVPLAIGKTQEFAPKGKTGETLGIFLTSYGVAITMGPFFCSSLLTIMPYSQVFQTAALIPIFGLIPLMVSKNMTQLDRSSTNKSRNLISSLNHIANSRNLIILTFLRLFFAITYGFFVIYFVLYAEDILLFSPALIALLLGVRGATDMSLRIPVGKFVDVVDDRVVIFTAFGILALAYYLISELTEFIPLAIVMVIYGFSLGLRVVSEWNILAKHSPPDARKVTAAYISTIFNIGSGIGAVLGGLLATTVSIPDLFKLASLLMVFPLILVNFIQKNVQYVSES
ncbi:MAG: MFS transporter [Candidatus Heimdallarchaeota archaeon]